jgi:hypothetical protein
LATHELIPEGAAANDGQVQRCRGESQRWPGQRRSRQQESFTGPDSREAPRTEDLERDLIFVGTVGIIDPPRQEVAVAIAKRTGPASAW